MKKIGIVMAALVIVTFMVGTAALMMPALAKAETVTTNVKIPVDTTVYNPCAGEDVDLSGDLHLLFHVTLDGNDGFHLKLHANAQGISGTGQTSGDKYQATVVDQLSINDKLGSGGTFEGTEVLNFRLIGQGPGNNLLVHMNLHITVNANGDVTAVVENVRIECK